MTKDTVSAELENKVVDKLDTHQSRKRKRGENIDENHDTISTHELSNKITKDDSMDDIQKASNLCQQKIMDKARSRNLNKTFTRKRDTKNS